MQNPFVQLMFLLSQQISSSYKKTKLRVTLMGCVTSQDFNNQYQSIKLAKSNSSYVCGYSRLGIVKIMLGYIN